MQTQRMKWIAGALVLFGFLVTAGASHASCTGSNRVGLSEAACLDGGHENTCQSRIFGACVDWASSHWAESQCIDKVVAKVDISGATDRTWHLNNFARRSGEHYNKTRGVYCCNDLGRCN